MTRFGSEDTSCFLCPRFVNNIGFVDVAAVAMTDGMVIVSIETVSVVIFLKFLLTTRIQHVVWWDSEDGARVC